MLTNEASAAVDERQAEVDAAQAEIETQLVDIDDKPFAARVALFVKMQQCKRKMKELDEWLTGQCGKIEGPLMEEMALAGMKNIGCDGMTVYIRTDHFVNKNKDAGTQEICDVLRKCGMAYMVADGYSAGSLKAKVLELIADQKEVPAELARLIKVGEVQRLVGMKS